MLLGKKETVYPPLGPEYDDDPFLGPSRRLVIGVGGFAVVVLILAAIESAVKIYNYFT